MIKFDDMDKLQCFVCKKVVSKDHASYLLSRFVAKTMKSTLEDDGYLDTANKENIFFLGAKQMCVVFHKECFRAIATDEYMFESDCEEETIQ